MISIDGLDFLCSIFIDLTRWVSENDITQVSNPREQLNSLRNDVYMNITPELRDEELYVKKDDITRSGGSHITHIGDD